MKLVFSSFLRLSVWVNVRRDASFGSIVSIRDFFLPQRLSVPVAMWPAHFSNHTSNKYFTRLYKVRASPVKSGRMMLGNPTKCNPCLNRNCVNTLSRRNTRIMLAFNPFPNFNLRFNVEYCFRWIKRSCNIRVEEGEFLDRLAVFFELLQAH